MIRDLPSLLIGVAAFAVVWRTKLSPALVVVAGVALGALAGLMLL